MRGPVAGPQQGLRKWQLSLTEWWVSDHDTSRARFNPIRAPVTLSGSPQKERGGIETDTEEERPEVSFEGAGVQQEITSSKAIKRGLSAVLRTLHFGL